MMVGAKVWLLSFEKVEVSGRKKVTLKDIIRFLYWRGNDSTLQLGSSDDYLKELFLKWMYGIMEINSLIS